MPKMSPVREALAGTEELLRHFLSLYQRSGEPGRIWDVLQAFRPVMGVPGGPHSACCAFVHIARGSRATAPRGNGGGEPPA